ncbi:MAG: hypothetical protein R8K20_00760, partial [Gallionellaceae bacterium]
AAGQAGPKILSDLLLEGELLLQKSTSQAQGQRVRTASSRAFLRCLSRSAARLDEINFIKFTVNG